MPFLVSLSRVGNAIDLNSHFALSHSFCIGRNPAVCDFVISLPSVSSVHCTLSRSADNAKIILSDHSRNGIFLNGKRCLSDCPLRNRDEFFLSIKGIKTVQDLALSFVFFLTEDFPLYSGRFLVSKQILGSGSYANVHLAYDTIGNTRPVRCAAKIIEKNRFKLQRKQMDHLSNEMTLLKSLDHLNIVKVFEVCEDEDLVIIFQEYVDGGELFDHLIRSSQLPEIEAKCYFYQILRGLKYLHDNKIAHRDIKPENILLETGQFSRVLLVDFGLASCYNSHSMKTFCGTANYLAPEILLHQNSAESNNGYCEKVDCWAAGVLLYAILSGELPFYPDDGDDDGNDSKVFSLICHDSISFSGPSWSNCSQPAIDLIEKLLIKNPSERISVNEALQHPWFEDNKAQVYYEVLLNNLNPETLLQ